MRYQFLTSKNVFAVENETTVVFEGKKLKVSNLKIFEMGDFDIRGEYIFESHFPNMPAISYPKANGGTFMPEESWTIIAHKTDNPRQKIWFTQHKQ